MNIPDFPGFNSGDKEIIVLREVGDTLLRRFPPRFPMRDCHVVAQPATNGRNESEKV
jgi:hypothetical protein